MTGKTLSNHQPRHEVGSDSWLTPPWVIEALGPFDLDPACSPDMPWRTADVMVAPPADGLSIDWNGTVWLNCPYSQIKDRHSALPWMERMARHNNGIALVSARTEVDWFQRWVFPYAAAILFPQSRFHFHWPDGTRAKANAGAPSVLIAYGMQNVERLRQYPKPAFLQINNAVRLP